MEKPGEFTSEDKVYAALLGILAGVALMANSESPMEEMKWEHIGEQVKRFFPRKGLMMLAVVEMGRKLGLEMEIGNPGPSGKQ